MPEQRQAIGTNGHRHVPDSAIRQERKLAEHAERLASRRRHLGKRTMLKVVTSLIALSVLSPLLVGSEENELVIRTTSSSSSFGPPVMVNDNKTNDQVVPVILAMPDYRLFIVWQDSRSGNEDIYASVSRDNGTTFGPSKRVDDSSGSSEQIEPAVAVSGNGTILLTWQDSRRSVFDYDIFFAKSYDDGATFTRNVKVDDSNGVISWQERPSIATTIGGAIFIAWTDDRTHNLRVRGAYSLDGGQTFSSSAEVAPSGGTSGQTGVALASNGDCIFAAFTDNITGTSHPYVCTSTDGGRSFTTPTRLDSTGSSGAAQRALSIAQIPGGGIVAAWEDSRSGGWDIYAAVVSADGTISTPDFRIDDDSTGANQRSPCVAADPLGNIYAVWEDERQSKYAIRFAYLVARNTRLTASTEVATPSINDMQRRPSIVATDPGRVLVVWQDDGAGSYDVYLSGATFPNLFSLSLVSGWNFASVPRVGWGYTANTLGLSNGDIVAGYNPETGAYDQIFVVGVYPPEWDFAISESTGYWIYSSTARTIAVNGSIPTTTQSRVITVPDGGGWAIVGFNTVKTTMLASDIPGMFTGGTIDVVAAYDAVTGEYNMYITQFGFTDFALVPGQAYWCACSASGTLTYTP
jgi:hypothetical protein